MAGANPTSDIAHKSNELLLELVLSYVCKTHGLNKRDFKSASTNAIDGNVVFTFKGLDLPGKFVTPVEEITRLLDDPLRGPVIRAAVPEFSKPVERIIFLMQQMQNPYTIRVTRNEIDNLIRKPLT